MRSTLVSISCLGLIVLASGCGQRVSEEKTLEMKAGEILAPIVLDGPKKEQKVKVEFTSSESPIDVYVILGKDENAILRELDKAAPKVEAVASKKQSKGETLSATIPAGKDYGVYLTNASKNTSVKVKVQSE